MHSMGLGLFFIFYIVLIGQQYGYSIAILRLSEGFPIYIASGVLLGIIGYVIKDGSLLGDAVSIFLFTGLLMLAALLVC